MRRLSSSLIIIFVSATALLFAGTSGALARSPQGSVHQDFPPRPGATPIVISLPNLNPPTATPGTSGRNTPGPPKSAAPPDAVRVALSNTQVKALLKGRAYRIQNVSSWLSGKGRLVVVGFYRATTVSGTWMAVGKPPYRATYRMVVSVQIYVSLPRHSVVGIVPHTAPK